MQILILRVPHRHHRPTRALAPRTQPLSRPNRSLALSRRLQCHSLRTRDHHQTVPHHRDYEVRDLLMTPSYRESIRIGWTILWRGVGSIILLLTVINAMIIMNLPELTRTSPSWGTIFFPFILTVLVGAFGIMPWLVKHLCSTSYSGFRLRLVHETSSAAPESHAMDH